jgi:hypothetical protein
MPGLSVRCAHRWNTGISVSLSQVDGAENFGREFADGAISAIAPEDLDDLRLDRGHDRRVVAIDSCRPEIEQGKPVIGMR